MDEVEDIEEKSIPAVETTKKARKPMSQEQLDKLAVAREKANKKRQELSEQRRIDKEKLIETKMQEEIVKRDAKNTNIAEREAKKRIANAPVRPPPNKTQKAQKSIIIEHSDSESEDDIIDAKVYRVKRQRETVETQPVPVQEQEEDPFGTSYAQLFGRSYNLL